MQTVINFINKKFIKISFYGCLIIFVLIFSSGCSFAKALKITNPSQTITIKAVVIPLRKIIKGTETIKYIKNIQSAKQVANNFRTRNGIRIKKIKNFGGGFKNIRGLYVKLSANLYLMLYPNNFYKKPKRLRDYNIHQLYPYIFNKGSIAVDKLSEKIMINRLYKLYIIKIKFRTKIPEAFGNFGYFKKEIVLNAPFYPYISANKNSNPPVNTCFKINLAIKNGYEAFFNGKIYTHRLLIAQTTNFISIILSKKFRKKELHLNTVSLNFFSPYPYNFNNKNKKIYAAMELLNRFHEIKLKRINIVYVHLRRSMWLKPPLRSNTLLVNTRFASVFPNFYIYQKLNLIRGIIYLNLINSEKTMFEKAGKNGYPFYSQRLQRLSFINFKAFLIKYSKKNPDIKTFLKHFNFIQGVNTIINHPIFPLSYIYFTGFPRTHALKNSVYYYNNDLNLIPYKKIKAEFLNLKKKDYYTVFVSGAGGNISPNSGRTEGYINFTLTKRFSYRNNLLFGVFKNYYNRGFSIGFSRQIGRFFPIPQMYKQSVFGLLNLMEISPEASGNSFVYLHPKRVAEFSLGYAYNSIDYNINPEYGSSFSFSYNIANSNLFSPFSFSQFMLQYIKNLKINAGNIIALRGIGVFALGSVPTALDYNLGGINGIMGIPASLPFVNNDTLIAEIDYRRNIYRGLDIDILNNLLNIRAVTADIITGAGKIGDTVPSAFNKGPLYSFAGLGIHFKTYFFGIYPEMISIYAAKAFGSGVSSEYGARYYIGLNQPF
ncbi:MAG: hypothetical protein M0016_00925 [Deltaproteobacteria bacterium]|jgi:hypothetical protein|nr:hypothetical protein [Deltaproteobacteria bacterium]MCL5880903.1 hypothetical protein [Deltaproteobacteria bacterium]MDA8303715.1 hypothetical protein [Deltaproteobacteria bacterium]